MKKKLLCMLTAMTLAVSNGMTAFAMETPDLGIVSAEETTEELPETSLVDTEEQNAQDNLQEQIAALLNEQGAQDEMTSDAQMEEIFKTGSTDGNDTKNTATQIELGDEVEGNIESGSDVDFYSVALPKDGAINIDFHHGSPYDATAGNWYTWTEILWGVILLDEEGNEYGTWSVKRDQDLATVTVGLPAGKYYIKVTGGERWNNVSYSLTASFTDRFYETEFNNSTASADALPLNQEIGGNLMVRTDVDYYKVTVEKKGFVKVLFSHVPFQDGSVKYWGIKLYNENDKENPIFSSTSSQSLELLESSEFNLDPGTYFVEVYGAGAVSTQSPAKTYNLKVSFSDVSSDPVQSFVIRLYDVCLSRYPDEQGLDDWTKQLKNGKKNAVDVVKGVLCSPEYLGKGKTNGQVVIDCYRAMLNREPDDTGFANWTASLDAGMSVNAIFAGFVGSDEFVGLCESYHISPGQFKLTEERDKNAGVTKFVSRLYTKALGRGYDLDGLNYWCGKINADSSKSNIMNVSTDGFFHSSEFLEKNLSNSDFVTVLYHTYLDREPDATGTATWVGLLDRGEKTRDQVMEGFAYSDEFKNIMASYGL